MPCCLCYAPPLYVRQTPNVLWIDSILRWPNHFFFILSLTLSLSLSFSLARCFLCSVSPTIQLENGIAVRKPFRWIELAVSFAIIARLAENINGINTQHAKNNCLWLYNSSGAAAIPKMGLKQCKNYGLEYLSRIDNSEWFNHNRMLLTFVLMISDEITTHSANAYIIWLWIHI